MKHLSQDPESRYNNSTVPWQRVINAKGIISPRYAHLDTVLDFSWTSRRMWIQLTSFFRSQPSGAQNQATALEAEGVTVTTGPLGELMVDFAEYGWFPRVLPSEAEDDEDEEGEEDGGR